MSVVNNLPQASGGTETLLWTNTSPTTARSSLDCTLSENIDGFTYIRVEYAYNNEAGQTPRFHVVFPVMNQAGTNYAFPSGNSTQRMCIGLNNASGNAFVRQGYVNSATSIHWNNAYRVNTSGSTNGNLIPWYIYGLK